MCSSQSENNDRLVDLQRQALTIQEILAKLPKPVNSTPEGNRVVTSPQPHEIYQNLGPLMGSGLRAPPALPPKGKKIAFFSLFLEFR